MENFDDEDKVAVHERVFTLSEYCRHENLITDDEYIVSENGNLRIKKYD